jgi:hypothetical protein
VFLLTQKGGHLNMSEMNDFVDELNSEFKNMVGGSYVSIKSGEIFTQKELDKFIKEKIEAFNIERFKESVACGVHLDQILTKKKPPKKETKTTYEGGDFNIVYRFKLEELLSMQLEVNEKLVYFVLRDFTVFPSNSIMINGQVPTFEELEPIIGLKERTIRKAVKALEAKGLFKLKQSGHKKVIYVSPSYYATGKNLEIDTVKMFDLM